MAEKSKSSANASAKSDVSKSASLIDPDDGLEWTEEMWQRAEIREGDKIIRPGRPPLDDLLKKVVVTIRLDPDVVESYRALGTGWQTQVNADLRKARKLGKKLKSA